jgi:hypothetical protein
MMEDVDFGEKHFEKNRGNRTEQNRIEEKRTEQESRGESRTEFCQIETHR